jgi:hypothetical protein
MMPDMSVWWVYAAGAVIVVLLIFGDSGKGKR